RHVRRKRRSGLGEIIASLEFQGLSPLVRSFLRHDRQANTRNLLQAVFRVGETSQLAYERGIAYQGRPALVTARAEPHPSRKRRLHCDCLEIRKLDPEMTSRVEPQRRYRNPNRPACSK